ncbi:exonuclease SbcCD subunit D [Kocuria tytonis]|uniref:Nuclease SbcCD subunit D n=1 Tax=Kocuria tytonis TaxID=2054280 RepID=A0A495AA53_9MICC|nr:exonuclease SbcCD subunit D [Kocuria tytonis]RKQ36633.1 exonuclease SbcCD subunit D [Kocuria tytonis]
MLFLHTSDWHLGRTFHGVDILDLQARAMAEIVGWVEQHTVDVVLVSGDVYDRAQPRTEVVELLNRTLADIRAAGAHVVLTSGNHDSPARLGFGSRIMSHGGVHLLTALADAARPVLFSPRGNGGVVCRTTSHGPADGTLAAPAGGVVPASSTVAVYGIPYLEPRAAATVLDCAPTHQAVLGAVMERIDADRQRRGVAASVVMAHAFVTGSQTTDSERIVDSGGLGTVSADIFTNHEYAALGHIHRRQRITDAVRYSGSPVAYSFSEAGHPKGAWLVAVDGDGAREVTALDHAAGLKLSRLKGALEALLGDPDLAGAEDAWCQVVLTDAERPAAAMERIRTRFPRTVELRWEPEGGKTLTPRAYGARVADVASPEELCARFFEHVRRRALSPEEAAEMASAVAAVQDRGATQ